MYYRKPSVDGGLGGQGSFSQRNRINGVSPLRSILQDENVFSEDTEFFFLKHLPGRGNYERLSMVGDQALPGATGDESQAVFIWRLPRGGKRMKDKKASKASRGPYQKLWPKQRYPCIHTAVITQQPWQSKQEPKIQGGKFHLGQDPLR